MCETPCQGDDFRVLRTPARHERGHSQARGQHVRCGSRGGRATGGLIQQRHLEGGQVRQRQENVSVGDEQVFGQGLGLLIREHRQRDHADAATAVVGNHSILVEVPDVGDRMNEQARVVIEGVHEGLGRLAGQPISRKVQGIDIEFGAQLADECVIVDARGREAMHADQRRRAGSAAAPAEHLDCGPGVGRRCRSPPEGRSTPAPFIEYLHGPLLMRVWSLSNETAHCARNERGDLPHPVRVDVEVGERESGSSRPR